MDRNELERLAKSYLDGTATATEKELLNKWYDNTHYENTVEIVQVEESETVALVKQRILNNINKSRQLIDGEKEYSGKRTSIFKITVWKLTTAAAVLFVFIGIAWLFRSPEVPGTYDKMVHVTAKKIIQISLFDGSKVWLSPNSVFIYPKKFSGNTRDVELVDGRAFFDIVHQSNHPFLVKTKALNITVLGTSFEVRTYKKEGTTKVSVITGKVGVTIPGQPDNPAVMLLPKQQALLSNIEHKIVTAPTNELVVNLWCKKPLVFEQENLNNVFKAIERQYNTHIEVADKNLLNQRISITLGNQRLDTIMEILSFTKNFKYKIANDSTVTIK